MKTLMKMLLLCGLAACAQAQAADDSAASAAGAERKPAGTGTHPRHSHAVEKGLIPPQDADHKAKRKPRKPGKDRHVHGKERH